MYKMCPIWPLHLIVIYLLALCPLWVLCQTAPQLMATFLPEEFEIHMDDTYYADVNITGNGANLQVNDMFTITTLETYVSTGKWNSSNIVTQEHVDAKKFKGRMAVSGHFLGRTDLILEVHRGTESFPVNGTLPVVVTRPVRVIDKIFNSSIGVFISLIFINFGCAMHWPTVKNVVKRPIGPLIGIAGQFLFMPLMTFGLGYLVFPDQPALRLGMFFTGVSPGGGASNIWTFILNGNLNLSLAMTTISTIASFGLMPAWLFSLGQVVFANAQIVVPYARIAYFVVGLIVPMSIGLAMQRWTPRLAAFMTRILKGFSSAILIFIIVFAIVTNLYIFELFNWRIVVAGMGIPWLGYAAGYLVARLCRQPHADALAISIETGIQNTGIAIFLLRYALPQPEADLTTVVPVSAAIMTPVPMTAIFIYQKIKSCIRRKDVHEKDVEVVTPVTETTESGVVNTVDVSK